MSLLDPFEDYTIPLREWANDGVRWIVDNYRPLFQEIKAPFDWILQLLEAGLGSVLNVAKPNLIEHRPPDALGPDQWISPRPA